MSRFSRASLWKELLQSLPSELRDSPIIESAFDIAFAAHEGQFRAERDPGRARIPYIVHPVGVAKLVVENWRPGELDADLATAVSVALLHDVLEDSSFEYEDIAEKTSREIADLCRQLTKPPVAEGIRGNERNRKFALQISMAGPTAIYVKICDALHNLSRPNGMPTTLLKKSIAKAERTYLPMLEGVAFEARMEGALRVAIAKCKESNAQRSEQEREFDPFDFAAVITHIEHASGTKLLELHDLVEILTQIPGVIHALCGAPEVLRSALAPVYPDYDPAFWDELAIAVGQESACRIARLPKSADVRLPFTHVMRLEETISVQLHRSSGITLAYYEAAVPSWFRCETVAAIVKVSGSKINRHMQDAAFAVQNLAKKYAVDVDPALVQQHALGEQDILIYAQARDMGQMFLSQIAYVIETIARKSTQERPHVQWRIKSLPSLLEKGERYGRQLSSDVEDFLGLRIVCVSDDEAQLLSRSISETLVEEAQLLLHSAEICDLSAKSIESTSGYRAIHITFGLTGLAFARGQLGCEIQIRTIFQHAWAQVSEAVRYKRHTSGRIAVDKQLRLLANRRDDAEKVVAAITAR